MGIGHASSSLSFKHLQYILEIYTYTLTWVSYQINSKLNVRIEQGKLFFESFTYSTTSYSIQYPQALKESEFIRAILFHFKKPPPSPSAPPALSLSLSFSLLFSYELGIEYRSLPLAQESQPGVYYIAALCCVILVAAYKFQ